jgi:hypothetical protein
LVYHFAIYSSVHFSSNIGRKSWSKWPKLKRSCRNANVRRDVARAVPRRALRHHTSSPPRRRTRMPRLTLVKAWSTWVITSKTSSAIPNDPLDQVNTYLWSNLGQRHGQTLLKPNVLELPPELLPRSPNFT